MANNDALQAVTVGAKHKQDVCDKSDATTKHASLKILYKSTHLLNVRMPWLHVGVCFASLLWGYASVPPESTTLRHATALVVPILRNHSTKNSIPRYSGVP